MQIILALLAGSFIGGVLGFIGAGGAMLSVPILIYGFNFAPKDATVAALAIVFSAAFAGVIPKLRVKKVLVKESLIIWVLGLPTNIGGALIARHLSDHFITYGFALILIAAGTSMLLGPLQDASEKNIPPLVLIAISLIIGTMTGIFGVGGGFLAIPVLVRFFHISLEKASGSSLLIITLNCLTAFIAHSSRWSKISWATPIFMALSAVAISIISSHHSNKISPRIMRRAFSILLYLIAIYSIFKTIKG